MVVHLHQNLQCCSFSFAMFVCLEQRMLSFTAMRPKELHSPHLIITTPQPLSLSFYIIHSLSLSRACESFVTHISRSLFRFSFSTSPLPSRCGHRHTANYSTSASFIRHSSQGSLLCNHCNSLCHSFQLLGLKPWNHFVPAHIFQAISKSIFTSVSKQHVSETTSILSFIPELKLEFDVLTYSRTPKLHNYAPIDALGPECTKLSNKHEHHK